MRNLNGRRAALALAVLAALAWAARYAGRRGTPPAPAAPVALAAPASAPAPAVEIPVKAKPAPRRPIVEAVAKPAETRGAGLREVGEAFGGRAPERIDRSAPASR